MQWRGVNRRLNARLRLRSGESWSGLRRKCKWQAEKLRREEARKEKEEERRRKQEERAAAVQRRKEQGEARKHLRAKRKEAKNSRRHVRFWEETVRDDGKDEEVGLLGESCREEATEGKRMLSPSGKGKSTARKRGKEE